MPEEQFPWLPVGQLVLNKNPENYFNEMEQGSFWNKCPIDGLDFSDDKMLQGRIFSYSDTQRLVQTIYSYQLMPLKKGWQPIKKADRCAIK